MAHERATRKVKPQQIVPEEFSWQRLLDAEGTQLEFEYTRIVDVIQPTPDANVVDPACGTGGFLLVAHDYASKDVEHLTPTQRDNLRDRFVNGDGRPTPQRASRDSRDHRAPGGSEGCPGSLMKHEPGVVTGRVTV